MILKGPRGDWMQNSVKKCHENKKFWKTKNPSSHQTLLFFHKNDFESDRKWFCDYSIFAFFSFVRIFPEQVRLHFEER